MVQFLVQVRKVKKIYLEKILCSEKIEPSYSNIKKFLFQEKETPPKKVLYNFSKESFSYISGNRKFSYFRKRNFHIFQEVTFRAQKMKQNTHTHFLSFRKNYLQFKKQNFRAMRNLKKTPLGETGCLCTPLYFTGCSSIQFFNSLLPLTQLVRLPVFTYHLLCSPCAT